jgi:SagB-type dehydrogenase family enzyme
MMPRLIGSCAGGVRGLMAFLMLLSSACAAAAQTDGQDIIRLPLPKTKDGMSLAEALARRRTQRKFSDQALSLEQVSQLCWAAQGITQVERGLRTAPSAGALFPMTIFLLDRNGVFEYRPKEHALHRLMTGDVRQDPKAGPLNQPSVHSAPICLVITMDVARLTAKFKEHAERYCLLEAGHVAQNVLLQATALGLAAVPVGGADEAKTSAALKLPENLRPVYLLPVGYPAKE